MVIQIFFLLCYFCLFVIFLIAFEYIFPNVLSLFPFGNRLSNKIRESVSSFINNPEKSNERIQLICLYIIAFLDLCFGLLVFVFDFDMVEPLGPFTDFFEAILTNEFLQFLATPEKNLLISYGVQEFLIQRSMFKLSKLMKYNILLIFALLMLQSLTVTLWDFLFHRTVLTEIRKYSFDGGTLIFFDQDLAYIFFVGSFVLFLMLYASSFTYAWYGKYISYLPPFRWITDSVRFWFKIKPREYREKKGKK